MKSLSQTTRFARDIKRMLKRGKEVTKLQSIVRKLAQGEVLEPKHRDHPLHGNWSGSRDGHIEPDGVLIYTASSEFLRLERTGTHSDLFE